MSEIHVAVGSYVVDALDDDERAEFEAHLANCESCQREVVEFAETTAQLAALSEATPPPALRGSILSAIREVRPLPPVDPEAQSLDDQRQQVVTQSSSSTESTPEPVLDELSVRRNRRPTRVLAFAVAAAMVVALALGGWVVNLVQERQAQVAASNAMTELLSAPDVQVYKKTMNGAPVSFAVSKSLNRAVITGTNVPTLPEGKTYQLWTLEGAAAVPNNLFNGGELVQTWFDGGVQQATGVAVTIEPASGSQAPTAPTVADASLT
ncbi:MAG: anti-sigma factor [Propionibacteriaceae bacterium]